MKPRPHYVLLLALLACLPSPIPLQAAPPERPKPDNAALLYWKAFVLMPQSKEDESYLDAWDTTPLGARVDELLKSADYPLKALHDGAAVAKCDWGLNYEEGPALMMPHLVRARQLGRLALLRVRQRFARGDARGAIDDAAAVLKLGRDAGDPILIAILVQYNIQNSATDAVAHALPKLDPAALTYLANQLAHAPADDAMRQVWATETQYMVNWVAERVMAVQAASDDEWRRKVVALPIFAGSAEGGTPLRAEDLPARQEMPKVLDAIRAYYREMEGLTDAPIDRQDQQFSDLRSRYAQEGALFKFLTPDVSKVFQRRRQWQVRRQMLLAAVAVRQDGPDALKRKEFADPFGNGAPFEYRKTDGDGFELQSKLTYDGKPVALTVGAPAPKS
jgi:hypothetical protein